MRYDKDLAIYSKHFEWYNVVEGKGYVSTEEAPLEAVEAMKRYNLNHIHAYSSQVLDENRHDVIDSFRKRR